jgi:uncharacterized protein with PQ loop repeat
MNSVAVVAGSISTALFVVSALPMLYKAARTKELGSYSLGYLLLANVGNGFHSIYVFSMPVGPIWALHSFYVVSSALMLFWYLRYEVSRRRHAWAGVATAAPPPDVFAPEGCPPPVAAPLPGSLAMDRRQASPLAMVGPV